MLKTYAAFTKSEVREKCSSGGIYAELANWILEQNGIVYASAYNEDFSVSFKRVVKKEELEETYGSKYTQSQLGNTFKAVKKDLDSGEVVLFCGLPCQVAGLKSFLKVTRTVDKNLYTVDLFCHGEPSAKVWTTYVEQNFGEQNLKKVNMRSKKSGWSYYNYSFEYTFEDHVDSVHNGNELYMKGYLENLYTKPACFNCQFKGPFNHSDITLGDFWGVDKVHPEMNDDKGTSAVVVHTEKGQVFIEKISDSCQLVIEETTLDNILSFNNSYVRKARENPQRHKFLVDCDKVEDINALIESNINISRMRRYKNKAIKLGNHVFEKFIKKESCAGCTACVSVCKQGAIKMICDEEGFSYPKLDLSKCIGCKMCVKACPVKTERLVIKRKSYERKR